MQSLSLTSTTDPASSSAVSGMLAGVKALVSFSFKKSSADKLSLSGVISVPGDFSIDGDTVIVRIGDYQETISVDDHGKAKTKYGTFRVKWNSRASTATFNFTAQRLDLQDLIGRYGFANETVKGKTIHIPVIIISGDVNLRYTVDCVYTAKRDSGGKAVLTVR
jgi:hypothetical protein